MVTIVYGIFSVLNAYSAYLFIDNCLGRRRATNKQILLGYTLFYIVGIFAFVKGAGPYTNLFMTLATYYLVGRLYIATEKKRVITALFLYVQYLMCDVFVFTTMSTILQEFPQRSPMPLTEELQNSIGIIFVMVLQFFVIKAITPLHKERNIELPLKHWITLFTIPVVSGIAVVWVNQQYKIGGITNLPLIYILIAAFSLINVIAFFFYDQAYQSVVTNHEKDALAQSHDNHQKEAALLHQSLGKISATKHDLDSHLTTGMGIAIEQKNDEMIAYFEPLVGEIRNIETGIKSGSPTIDTTLNSCLYTARDQNTQLHIDLKMKEEIPINPIDLTTILSNLLNNALEACIKLPEGDRQIWFYLKHERGVLNVRVKNTYNPDAVDIQDGKAHTTKEDKSAHGIGLKRIQQTVEKYNGTFSYRVKATEYGNIFEAKAMLFTK